MVVLSTRQAALPLRFLDPFPNAPCSIALCFHKRRARDHGPVGAFQELDGEALLGRAEGRQQIGRLLLALSHSLLRLVVVIPGKLAYPGRRKGFN